MSKTKKSEQTVLCNMRIGFFDKQHLKEIAAKAGLSFQQFAIESILRRINGEPPIEKIRRIQYKYFDAVITCRFTEQQRIKVHKAAKKEGLSVTDYVLGAVFGNYRPNVGFTFHTSSPQSPKQTLNKKQVHTSFQSRSVKQKGKITPKSESISQSLLCNMRIGSIDKQRIQKVISKERMTFQVFAVKSIERRINGEPPVKRIQRKQFKNFDAVITCRFTEQQRVKVHKAAKREGLSVTDYVLGAVFGDYQCAPVSPVYIPAKGSDSVRSKTNAFTTSEKEKQFHTCTMSIGHEDKSNIQKTAREVGMTLQQFAIESVFRRIHGKPPVKRTERQQKQSYISDSITCRFNEWQKKEVEKAAQAEQLSITKYVLGAIFGDYQYSPVSPVQESTEQSLNKSSAHRPLLYDKKRILFTTPVQNFQQSSNKPKEDTFSKSKEQKEQEQTFLWHIRIGYKDMAQIRKTLRQIGMSFQQLAVKSVLQRLAEKPPVKRMERLERKLRKDHYSVINCSFTKQQRKKIHKAALVAGTSVEEYILDAIFGDYLPTHDIVSKINPAKKDTHLYYLRIGTSERERIQRAANLAGRSFDRYLLRAVKYRLKGLSPIQTIPHSLFKDTVTEIKIPGQIVRSKKVRMAAKREKITLKEYIHGAIFGDYKPHSHTPPKQS